MAAFWFSLVMIGLYGLGLIFWKLFVHSFGVASLEQPFMAMAWRGGEYYASIATTAYAFYRVFRRHPISNGTYAKWLASTPWRFGDALPLGPVHLVWEDLVPVLAGIGITSLGPLKELMMLPAAAFIVVYSGQLLMAAGGYGPTWWAGRGATGLGALPDGWRWYSIFGFYGALILYWDRPLIQLVVVGCCGFLSLLELAAVLSRFSWEARESQARRLGLMRLKATHWFVGPHPPPEPLSRQHQIAVPVLVSWTVFCVLMSVPDARKWDVDSFASTVVLFFVIGLVPAFIRLIVYLNGHFPPMSFLGRLATGRWLIWGFDIVFLGPLIAVITTGCFATALFLINVPPPLTLGLAFGIAALSALSMPPTLRQWQLTGHYKLMQTSRALQLEQRQMRQRTGVRLHAR